MQETIQKYKEKLIEYWNGLTRNRKISLVAIIIAALVVLFLIFNYFTRVEYKVLYSGLPLKDQSKITAKLDELSIPYKLEGTSSILVPAEEVNRARIELAGDNLPSSGYDYDSMFQDSSWSQTSFDKSVRLKRWKEETLQQSIESIEGISNATVMLTIPDNTNFVLAEQEVLPSASVTIVWDGGGSRRAEIVKSIQNIVATSTVKLTPDNVTVIDNEGALLSSGMSDSFVSDEAYAIQSKHEALYDQKIKYLLEHVVGRGNVTVMTSVKISMDVEKTVGVKYAPPLEGEDEGLIRSMDTLKETMQGGSAVGVPGTETNIEDYETLGSENSLYNKQTETINRELNELRTEVRKTPGQIENITISVILNKKALPNEELTTEDQALFIDVVKNAAGSNVTQVSVIAKDFAEPEVIADAEEKGFNFLPILIIALILIALLVFLLLRARAKKKAEEEAEAERLRELALKKELGDEDMELEFETDESRMKKQIDLFIEQRPEAVVQLLRNWLNE
ncbi:MAG: flagellar M-ring protein FliF [Tissierellia bacterium]|nr:flagellar M-ring protein FliF [Tissierellia bacterium]